MSVRVRHLPEGDDTSVGRAADLTTVKTSNWLIEEFEPRTLGPRSADGDRKIAVEPLTAVPGYGFPCKLTAKLTSQLPAVWFTLHLTIEHDGHGWPQLVEETRKRKPDWIRNPDNEVIGWRPHPAGADISIPLQRTIMPTLIAYGAVPLTTPLLSQLGRHQDLIRSHYRRGRRRQGLTEARLYEIRQHYTDACADPNLNEGQRRDYVAHQLGKERSDSIIRDAITHLKHTGQLQQPAHQLPITTTRIRYRIRADTDINHISIAANPNIEIEAGQEYEETSWERIRIIAHQPEIEYEILEKRPR